MTARGKPGKPKAGFPPFPPSLENPQTQRVSHIPTASTTGPYIRNISKAGLRPSRKPSTRRVGQNKLPKWAKISCQSQLRRNDDPPSLRLIFETSHIARDVREPWKVI